MSFLLFFELLFAYLEKGISFSFKEVHPLKTLSPKTIFGDSNEMLFNDVQSSKEESNIITTEGGIVICVNEVHCLNTFSPMQVTAQGSTNETSVKEEHPEKVKFSMFFKEEGIDTFFNDIHPSKEEFPR